MNISENNEMRSVHFDSISELINFDSHDIKNENNKNVFIDKLSRVKDKDPIEWYGGKRKSAKNVISDALLGWEDGYKIASKNSNALSEEEKLFPYLQIDKKYKRKKVKKDFGDEIDIHKVLQGNINTAWTKTENQKTNTKFQLYTIMIDIGAVYYIKAEDTLWTATVALKLTEYLIKSGKSVKILIGSTCTNLTKKPDSKKTTTDVIVKHYNEPLSMSRLAAMANCGFHRVFNFCARCFIEDDVNNDTMGVSRHTLDNHPPIQMTNEIKKRHTKYIYLPMCDTEKKAISVLKKIIQESKSSLGSF